METYHHDVEATRIEEALRRIEVEIDRARITGARLSLMIAVTAVLVGVFIGMIIK